MTHFKVRTVKALHKLFSELIKFILSQLYTENPSNLRGSLYCPEK